jgi:hypothetical protein
VHQEAKIYLGYAVVGGVLTAYVLDKLLMLTQRAVTPLDVALFTAVFFVFGALTAFYAVLAFAFAARFIDQVTNEGKSIVLHRRSGTLVKVHGDVRVIRRFGRQFSSNEDQPAFVLFIANGRLWVRSQERA